MAGKFSFRLQRASPRRDFPNKIVLRQQDSETPTMLMAGLGDLLSSGSIQIDVNLDMDSIPFRPDVVELDYEMRPRLWIECGECSVNELDKLAVKVPRRNLDRENPAPGGSGGS